MKKVQFWKGNTTKKHKRYNNSPFWHAPASLVHINEIKKTKIISSDQLQKKKFSRLHLLVHETNYF